VLPMSPPVQPVSATAPSAAMMEIALGFILAS
jgi:hypothetical protein